MTAALKQQFQRHCFIQIRQQETQPMLVPFVEPVTTFTYNRQMLDYYVKRQHERQQALPSAEVDVLLEEQEKALFKAVALRIAAQIEAGAEPITLQVMPPPQAVAVTPIWNRVASPRVTQESFSAQARKRGPKADTENHDKVGAVITRSDGIAHTWSRGRHHYQHLVIKAIKDRLKAAVTLRP